MKTRDLPPDVLRVRRALRIVAGVGAIGVLLFALVPAPRITIQRSAVPVPAPPIRPVAPWTPGERLALMQRLFTDQGNLVGLAVIRECRAGARGSDAAAWRCVDAWARRIRQAD